MNPILVNVLLMVVKRIVGYIWNIAEPLVRAYANRDDLSGEEKHQMVRDAVMARAPGAKTFLINLAIEAAVVAMRR